MADTYEKFLQRVFSSPDLTKINEFNSEIQGFLATRMGLLSWTSDKQKQVSSPNVVTHRPHRNRGARRGSEVSSGSGGSHGGGGGTGTCGVGGTLSAAGTGDTRRPFASHKDNKEMTFWVDEVDNYSNIPVLLSLGDCATRTKFPAGNGKEAGGGVGAHGNSDGATMGKDGIASDNEDDGGGGGRHQGKNSKSDYLSIGIFDAPIMHHCPPDGCPSGLSRTQEGPEFFFREVENVSGSRKEGADGGGGRFKLPSVKQRTRKQTTGGSSSSTSKNTEQNSFTEGEVKSLPLSSAPPTRPLVRRVVCDYRTGGPEMVKSVVFTSAMEDEFLAVGHLQEYLSYRSIEAGQPIPRVMKQEHDGPVNCVTVSRDVRLVATCGDDARLCVVDLLTKQCILILYHPGAVTCAAFSANSQFVISGCGDCKCRLWRTKPSTAPRELATYCGLHDRVTAIEFQSTGGLVAAGSKSGEVQLWVGSTLELVHSIGENILTSAIIALSFNWNNEVLLSADMKNILFSDVHTGSALKLMIPGDWVSPSKLRGLYENVDKPCFTFATFAPKGLYPNYFLLGKGDCTIILYELHIEKKNDSTGGGNRGSGNGSLFNNLSSRGMTSTETIEIKEVDEVWSTKLRAPSTCAFGGFSEKMILGDTSGNTVVLHLEPLFSLTRPPSIIGTPVRVCLSYPK